MRRSLLVNHGTIITRHEITMAHTEEAAQEVDIEVVEVDHDGLQIVLS